MRSDIPTGTFFGGDIEDGVFHGGADIEPGTFHRALVPDELLPPAETTAPAPEGDADEALA